MSDFEHRKALMACFREIQDDDGNEYFTVEDDAYGYNADSQCVWVMLESQWEGYTLAVVCPTYSDAYFVVTNDDTGEEYHYSTREKLMEEEFLEEESDEEESDEEMECSECHISIDSGDNGSVYDDDGKVAKIYCGHCWELCENGGGEWCSAKCEEDEGCRKCNPFAFQTTDEMATYLNNKL
jgi:hypothetical protein